MPSEVDRLENQELKSALEKMLTIASTAAISDLTTLPPAFTQVQELFTTFMASFQDMELNTTVAPRWQSLQTEMHKQMRLLGIDVMFLQASRPGNMAQQRQKQIVDRLKILIDYCAAF